MLRAAPLRTAVVAGRGPAAAAAVPRLCTPAGGLCSPFRRLHVLPTTALAASSFLRGDSLSRHALLAPQRCVSCRGGRWGVAQVWYPCNPLAAAGWACFAALHASQLGRAGSRA